MTFVSCLQRALVGSLATVAALAGLPILGITSQAAAETYEPLRTPLAGFVRSGPKHVDVAPDLDLVVELEPKDRQLDSLAAEMVDPASPVHRSYMSEEQFAARFGRSQTEVETLAAWLRANNARDVYVSRNRLVVGGYLTLDEARRALGARFDVYEKGDRLIVAPIGPVNVPVSGIRSVHGLITAFDPRLADVPSLPNDFRGAWFAPVKFREGYDAVPNGGANQRIALIEDSSDRFDLADLGPFMTGAGAGLDMLYSLGPPPGGRGGPHSPEVATSTAEESFAGSFGAQPSRVREQVFAQPLPAQDCGRDDRGQEADMDVDTALTLAPMATIDVRYERVCVRGGEGIVALQRALDDSPPPDVIVFPFNLGPVQGPTEDLWGPTPIPYLEAAVRGLPLIVPAGDDGAVGYHITGDDQPGLAYPCVLSLVICTGGTQLGLRSGSFDEGPWNDGLHASGGGISWDPRPSWQNAPSAYEFSKAFDLANHRMVPDIAADASGHLEIFWHGYGLGGVGGTSESAAIVGAQLATINGVVPAAHRILSVGDLYTLASTHPEIFRHVTGDNDRGYFTNTLHPKPLPPPIGYRGVLPSPPPQVNGCQKIQPRGCDVQTGDTDGYNPVTGIGSLKEKEAIDALSGPTHG